MSSWTRAARRGLTLAWIPLAALGAGCEPDVSGKPDPAFRFRVDVVTATDQDPLAEIEEVRLTVISGDGSTQEFAAAAGEEVNLEGVDPGEGVTFVVDGLVGGEAVFSGRSEPVDVADGGRVGVFFAREGTVGRIPTELYAPRAYAAAHRLADGRVVVLGGSTWNADSGAEDLSHTIEVLDPTEPALETTEVVTQAFGRIGGAFAAVRSEDPDQDGDLVYLGGGIEVFDPVEDVLSDEEVASADVMVVDGQDPDAGAAWAGEIEVSGDPWPRLQAVAAALPDGRIALFGGYLPSSGEIFLDNYVLVFDPVTGQSSAGDNLRRSRMLHAVAPLPGGEWLVAGGAGFDLGASTFGLLATVEVWDGDGSATSGPDMASPRVLLTATPLPDGTVLLAGGGTISATSGVFSGTFEAAEVYLPDEGTVVPTVGTPNRGRAGHTATPLPNGDVLLCGGVEDNDSPQEGCEIYRFATGEFEGVPDDPDDVGDLGSGGRAGAAAVALPGGDVLYLGGRSGRPQQDIFRYHCTAAEATPFAARPSPAPHRRPPAGARAGAVTLSFP